MEEKATITLGNKTVEYPIITGSEGEKAIDIRSLRSDTGHITYDDGFGNTGSCISDVTFIDGEKGILRYRGIPIEELAEHSDFLSVAHLVIYGELPDEEGYKEWMTMVRNRAPIHTGLMKMFEGYPPSAHPMAVLSSMLNSLGCYYPQMTSNDREHDLAHFEEAAALLISKVRTIAALTYRSEMGMPFIYPRTDLRYTENFLHMMFSQAYNLYEPSDTVVRAFDLFLTLHADHEQNCSTSTVRMVASGGANLFASVAAGVGALWGPLHGGANTAVVKMLQSIYARGDDGSRYIEAAKKGEERLMGFGHRVYKNYDPRAKILGEAVAKVLGELGVNDPLLNIARRLEEAALSDDYFVSRKLYPNVDFYSGLLLKAIGVPVEMFTVMFAMGRMPGWIANWKEVATAEKGRIYRPRQVYNGHKQRTYEDAARG